MPLNVDARASSMVVSCTQVPLKRLPGMRPRFLCVLTETYDLVPRSLRVRIFNKDFRPKIRGKVRGEDPAGTCAGQFKSVNWYLRDKVFALLAPNNPILKDHLLDCGAGDLIIEIYDPDRLTVAPQRAGRCNIP